jgi:FtsH-binding integral membrane protein
LFPVGGAVGLVGLVLLVLEATRALTGNSLGSLGEVLLWVGVGLAVAGGVLLLLTVRAAETAGPDLDGGQPANG